MRSYLATILSFIAVLLTLGAVLYIFYMSREVSPSPSSSELDKSQAFEARQVELLEQQEQKFQELIQTLQDEQKAQVNKLVAELEQIARRLLVLERDIAQRPLPGALVRGSDLLALRGELEKELDSLSQRVHQPRGSAFALLGLSFVRLKHASATGANFKDEIENLSLLLSPTAELKGLGEFASGVRSRARLEQEFESAVKRARQVAEGDNFSSSPLLSFLGRLVKVRPLGEVEGTDSFALLSQLTARMEEGDMASALALEAEVAKAHEVYRPLEAWFVEAKRRQRLDGLLVELDKRIYNLLARNIKKGIKKGEEKKK